MMDTCRFPENRHLFMLQPWWISSCCSCFCLFRRRRWYQILSWWGSWIGFVLLCSLWVTAPLGLHPAWSSPISLTSSWPWPSVTVWWSPRPASLDIWWVDNTCEACYIEDCISQKEIAYLRSRLYLSLYGLFICLHSLNWFIGLEDLFSIHSLLTVRSGGACLFKLV